MSSPVGNQRPISYGSIPQDPSSDPSTANRRVRVDTIDDEKEPKQTSWGFSNLLNWFKRSSAKKETSPLNGDS